MSCPVCGISACGLASHKTMAKQLQQSSDVTEGWLIAKTWESERTKARENLEMVTELVQKRLPDVGREKIIAKALELDPELFYGPDAPEAVAKADEFENERRDLFVDVESLADRLQMADVSLTRSQAVAKALEMRPDIYERAVLMTSDDVPVQQESAR